MSTAKRKARVTEHDVELERIRLEHQLEMAKIAAEQRVEDNRISIVGLQERARMEEDRLAREGRPPLRLDDQGRVVAICENCERRRATLERIAALAASEEPNRINRIAALAQEGLGL